MTLYTKISLNYLYSFTLVTIQTLRYNKILMFYFDEIYCELRDSYEFGELTHTIRISFSFNDEEIVLHNLFLIKIYYKRFMNQIQVLMSKGQKQNKNLFPFHSVLTTNYSYTSCMYTKFLL